MDNKNGLNKISYGKLYICEAQADVVKDQSKTKPDSL